MTSGSQTGPEILETFCIGRSALRRTKDEKLCFVNELGRIARYNDAQLYSGLGMAAIDIVGKHAAADLQDRHAKIRHESVKERVGNLASTHSLSNMRSYLTFALGDVKTIDIGSGQGFIGAVVIDEHDTLGRELRLIQQCLSDLAGADVDLPPIEFFLNLGQYDEYAVGIEDVIDYAAFFKPAEIDVANVQVHHAKVLKFS